MMKKSVCIERSETFCYYCQKDYKNLFRHILRVHPNTYASCAVNETIEREKIK